MQDWIVAFLLGLACFFGAAWGLRFRLRRPDSRAGEGSLDREVPNIRVEPHPDHLPVALLDFQGPPGAVPVMRGVTVIGRHSEDDVRVRDVRVSRHHARLTAGSGRFEICNLTTGRAEPNPMLVNGTRRENAEVVDGDVITLGGVSFTFRQARSTG